MCCLSVSVSVIFSATVHSSHFAGVPMFATELVRYAELVRDAHGYLSAQQECKHPWRYPRAIHFQEHRQYLYSLTQPAAHPSARECVTPHCAPFCRGFGRGEMPR